MDADSFYDRLLASIVPTRTGRIHENAQKISLPKSSLPAPPAETVVAPQPISVSTPPNAQHTDVSTESLKAVLPIEEPAKWKEKEDEQTKEDSVTLVDSVGVNPTTLRGNAKPYVPTSALAPTVPKNSATLEAELRSLLLASKKRKASGPPPRPPPLPPSKRPPRGSPVFTAVTLAGSQPSPEEPTLKAALTQSPVSTSLPSSEASPQTLHPPHGKLALPPKPPQRDGFRLRVKLPFPFGASSSIMVETEKLPLCTPISAILDLFNRRAAQDHLYFASTSTHPDPPDTPDTGSEEAVGLGLDLDAGQRFYRDQPNRSSGRRDAPAARGGPGWDANARNLRATLEDVATVAGAEVVECEIRSDPRVSHRPGTSGTEKKRNGYFEEEGNDGWQEVDNGGEDSWHVSPAMEQGPWGYYHESSYLQPQQQWGFPWQAAMNWIPEPKFHQPIPLPVEVEPEAQRWIPGHKDYDAAGWMYGFVPQDHKEEEESVPSHPPRPPPPRPPPLHVPQGDRSGRKEGIIEPSITSIPPAVPVSALPPASVLPTAPPLPPVPRGSHQSPPDNKKHKKRGNGGGVRSGAMRRKKAKELSAKSGRGRSKEGRRDNNV
ncbi:hypothetical protein BDD12DRAFT_828391 [Trichophaea hybrida]|nr:hypothetical protein BDD12DRAFT_828391 [Trichophaea hybrida]